MLFEHLQSKIRIPALVDALNMSFYSAILGRSIARETAFGSSEEAFISALFHNLGRTLAALYLPAEVEAIRAEGDQNQDAAVVRVLGLSYTSLGAAVARALNLPPRLLQSMNRMLGPQAHAAMAEDERLACLATLSNGITDALATAGSPKMKRHAIDKLVTSYGPLFAGLEGDVVAGLIAQAEAELREHAKVFRLDLDDSAFANGLSEMRENSLAVADASHAALVSAAGGLVDLAEADLPAEDVPEVVLTQGLHEVTSLLVTDFTLDDVLRVILETIYRALGVGHARAFFLLKDPSQAKLRFRFGMGQSAADMRLWMEVPVRGTQDLFALALSQERDLVIKDLAAPDLGSLMPDWYQPTARSRRYAVLLPLVVSQKAVGLFYIDGDDTGARLLTPTVLNNLKVLRSQAVLAIHQSTLRSAGRKR
jgi:hypothetical protein